jgi:hypothetical protein
MGLVSKHTLHLCLHFMSSDLASCGVCVCVCVCVCDRQRERPGVTEEERHGL